MSGSLSVVLPVFNAERTLARNLQHVLEVLSDLDARFEVLVVDQGSTDQTADVAHEMAVTFPQLRVARRRLESDETDGLGVDLQQTTGEFVFVHEGHMPFNANDFRRLWEVCRTGSGGTTAVGVATFELGRPARASTTDVSSPEGGLSGPGWELRGIHALRRQAP